MQKANRGLFESLGLALPVSFADVVWSSRGTTDALRTSPGLEGCSLDGEDAESTSSFPLREMGVCNGVRHPEVRSDPGCLNHTQDFAPELLSNLRSRNTVLWSEEMLAKRGCM